MIDLGKEEPDWSASSDVSPSPNKEAKRPMRTVYPEIRLESKDAMPKLPDGEFYFIARGKVTGFREPPNTSMHMREISVLAMEPISDADADGLIDTTAKESPLRSEIKKIKKRSA